jgi:NhaP-type Na+/H+ or K+/H+ antiporter
MYAVAKLFHLSSLLIILVFGLLLGNYKVLLWGQVKRWFKDEAIDGLFENFRMVTVESSFIVRTFFFVVFGISFSLESLTHPGIWLMSGGFILILYVIRVVLFYLVDRKDVIPQIFLAPRGLISILLFYAIPTELQVSEFENGTLLLVIMASSLIMAGALILDRKSAEGPEDDLPAINTD